MAETKNIARMAQILSDDLFAEFLWLKTGPEDTNWPCEDEDHALKTHPSDVVFFYENPYSLTRTYVNCDLKSYSSSSITKTMVAKAIESLAKALACAEKSNSWQQRFAHDQVQYTICGLLFVYNHDGGYEKEFASCLASAEPDIKCLPRDSAIFVLGPEDVLWLNNVGRDIVQMRGKGEIPSRNDCYFFYPNLSQKNNVQPTKARAANLEMLTGPWLILGYEWPSTNRRGFVIYYREAGRSTSEFVYLFDYLMSYQMLCAEVDIRVRSYNADQNAAARFGRAIDEYTGQCENSEEIRLMLKKIQYSGITQIVPTFSEIEIGMDND